MGASIVAYITGLKPIELLVGFAAIIGSIALLLIVMAFVLDKLNIKSFSFRHGFTFYQDGETRKRRIVRRRKNAR